VKLWTQAYDSKGSTVSQFHSFTKRHGGWGLEYMGGWGAEGMGGGCWSRVQVSGFRGQKDRDEGVGEEVKE